MNLRKFKVVPEPIVTRQDIARAKIEQRNRELIADGFKAYSYKLPETQAMMWDQNESSRKGTRTVVIVDSPVPKWKAVLRALRLMK